MTGKSDNKPVVRLTVLLALVLCGGSAAHAARERLVIDATSHVFNWEEDYAIGLSPDGPVARVGNLSLHVVGGHYGDVRRLARVGVYDTRPDRSRTFLATGYRFEAKSCGPTFLVLNWTGTLGEEELTLVQLVLVEDNGHWRIGEMTLTRHSTKRHSTILDIVPWSAECTAVGE